MSRSKREKFPFAIGDPYVWEVCLMWNVYVGRYECGGCGTFGLLFVIEY